MIWFNGHVQPSDELRIPCTDRVFEHGLGLFETLRTWNQHARLLPRHLHRLERSAETLGLPINRALFPNPSDVRMLLHAMEINGDALLRIVLTGGRDHDSGSILWMTARPIQDQIPTRPWVARSTWQLSQPPVLEAFKTLNYWRNRILHAKALHEGFDEDIGRDALGRFHEGTRCNLFALQGGRLLTPAADGQILPGILRGLVLELAPQADLEPVEVHGGLTLSCLQEAEAAFLTNSGRGLIRLSGLDLGSQHPRLTWPLHRESGPSPIERLDQALRVWLSQGDQEI